MSRQLAQSARKRFGQNFLVDGRVIDAIVASINPSPNDSVVEIGPGHGAITSGLYSSGCDLTLIELDRDLVPNLLASFVSKSPNRCRLINQDALTVDFGRLGTQLRIVGNLPYNIGTPLLFRLLEHVGQIKDIHVMLQKEVVNRIAAAPGNSAYGRLSVMIQATSSVEPLFDVSPESFTPAPKVESCAIRIIPNTSKRVRIQCMDTLTDLVRQSFGQRRKTLRNNLKDIISLKEFDYLEINPQGRPEQLSVDTYIELGNYIARQRGTA